MELHHFCQEMGFSSSVENQLSRIWEQLDKNSSSDFPDFMKRPFYEKYLPLCGIEKTLEAEILRRMDQVSAITAQSATCSRYAAMLHYGAFLAAPALSFTGLPLPDAVFGENAGIFQLMCALSALPLIEARYRTLGLPEHFLPAAANWLSGTVQIYQAAHHGIPGFTLQQISWLRFDIDGMLFRIGRLEYLLGNWRADHPAVYRHRSTGELTVFCGDRWKISSRGEHLSELKEDFDWMATLQEKDGTITGFPITSDGIPHKEQPLTLSLQDWQPLVSPWDMIPSIHIPGGGGMTPEAVRSSMQEAVKFFRRYFKTDIKAFVCNSWILNPVWQKELPDSNMAKLQRNVHMLPPVPAQGCGLFFVYGTSEKDPRSLQRTNRLHEAFCRIYDRGETLQYGGMFILKEEIDRIGLAEN